LKKLDPKTDGATTDIVEQNIEKLKALFPDVFTEGKVDLDALRETLGDYIDDRQERYSFTWNGKSRARRIAQTPSTGTLRPCPEESVNWDTTQNLFIEGDNLEVLKLLQKSYHKKVKMIYIDPPYNTGGDFIYPDDFHDNIKNYLELTGQTDGEGRRLSTNAETSGRYHTDWLNMMYPRLKLARNLLKEEGAIFASCDEVEQSRLRLVMDEIFGEENFVADIVWAAGRKNDSRMISISHEYIVCYVRDASYLREKKLEWRQRKKGLKEIYAQYEKIRRQFKSDYAAMTKTMKSWYKILPDNHPAKAHKHYCHIDQRGLYFPDNISWPGGGGPKYEVLHPVTGKPVRIPSRGWMTPDPEKMQQWVRDDLVHFGKDEDSVPCIKSYLKDREYQAPYSVFYQDGRAASKRLRALMEGDIFPFPKDELIIKDLIGMLSTGNDIILDFFAGSCTTAHAVLDLNKEDGGNRKFIMVQLPEPCDENSEAFRAGYKTIAEIGKERMRRVITKINEQLTMNKEKAEGELFTDACSLDIGFKVFKLDTSNIKPWDADFDNLETALFNAVENIKPDRSEADVLYELLLKYGLDLAVPIKELEIEDCGLKIVGGKEKEDKSTISNHKSKIYIIGAGALIVCLADKISLDVVEGIAALKEELKPEVMRVVFKDSGFADDVVKTNAVQILRQAGIEDVKSL